MLTSRDRRHYRIRKQIRGTKERPRLAIFRSHQHIYAQLIDDEQGRTLLSESDRLISSGTKVARATLVGEKLAKKAIRLKINKVVFDRGGFAYHGRVAALAQAARKGGLVF